MTSENAASPDLTERAKQGTGTLNDRGGFTVDEFCRWMPMSRGMLYKEAGAGRIRLRKLGRKTIITLPDAVAYRDGLPDAGLADVA